MILYMIKGTWLLQTKLRLFGRSLSAPRLLTVRFVLVVLAELVEA